MNGPDPLSSLLTRALLQLLVTPHGYIYLSDFDVMDYLAAFVGQLASGEVDPTVASLLAVRGREQRRKGVQRLFRYESYIPCLALALPTARRAGGTGQRLEC